MTSESNGITFLLTTISIQLFVNTRNQRDQVYVFWFSEFRLQNYFHIKRGNGQVDSKSIAGNKVEKKRLFCQLGFGTVGRKKNNNKTLIFVRCLCANLSKTLTVLLREQGPTQKQ